MAATVEDLHEGKANEDPRRQETQVVVVGKVSEPWKLKWNIFSVLILASESERRFQV